MIELNFDFSNQASPADVRVELVQEGQALTGARARAAAAGRFTGKREQICDILGGEDGRLILLGLGEAKALKPLDAEKLGASLWVKLGSSGAKSVCVDMHEMPTAALVGFFAVGLRLRAYAFDKYLTKQSADKCPSLRDIKLFGTQPERAQAAFETEAAVTQGVHLARDLVAEAPNVLYPQAYADLIQSELAPLGVEIEILDEPAMEKLGMGALLGVGMGSDRASRMVIMRWNGADDDSPAAAFVGKGVTGSS